MKKTDNSKPVPKPSPKGTPDKYKDRGKAILPKAPPPPKK